MNTQDNHPDPVEATAAAPVPPPFEPEPTPDAEPTPARPELADLLTPLSLNDDARERLAQVAGTIALQDLTPELLTVLAHGVMHDDDVKNADAQGYLRGRNENIQAVLRPPMDDERDPASTVTFPRYTRRSIWDK